jgi:mediator of RNA polymerase II transcription subunit 17
MPRREWNCSSNSYDRVLVLKRDRFDKLFQVDSGMIESQRTTKDSWICDLIYSVLQALLLRMHGQLRSSRLGGAGRPRSTGVVNPPRSPLLQPIIDLLQYQSFCNRVKSEANKMVKALGAAGIPSILRFTAVGESGKELAKQLDEGSTVKMGGEAVLRIDNRY